MLAISIGNILGSVAQDLRTKFCIHVMGLIFSFILNNCIITQTFFHFHLPLNWINATLINIIYIMKKDIILSLNMSMPFYTIFSLILSSFGTLNCFACTIFYVFALLLSLHIYFNIVFFTTLSLIYMLHIAFPTLFEYMSSLCWSTL